VNRQHKTLIAGAIGGIAVLLVVKYVVVGLKAWNAALHPGRQDDPTGIFYCPLLRLTGPCEEVVTHSISF
jgi:hypothetical protein